MSPIVYELGLVIVALVGFVAWQSVTLKRDMRLTRERREREAARQVDASAPDDAASTPAARDDRSDRR